MFIEERVEVLVEEEQTRSEQRLVQNLHLTLGHVGHLPTPKTSTGTQRSATAVYQCTATFLLHFTPNHRNKLQQVKASGGV